MSSPTPTESLLAGVEILAGFLLHHGFVFMYRGDGLGSGGSFAWGEYLRDDRRLELHYRFGLGGVAYHAAGARATHEAYMRELGVLSQCQYPGFSSEYLQGFRALAHDLDYAKDFLVGDAKMLLAACLRESSRSDDRHEQVMAGDTRKLADMHAQFKARHYADVVAIFNTLHAPHLLSDAQRRLVQLARERASE